MLAQPRPERLTGGRGLFLSDRSHESLSPEDCAMVMRLTRALPRVGRSACVQRAVGANDADGGAGRCRCATVERARETHHH
eukprot:553385-Prymnesium_polylepis.1